MRDDKNHLHVIPLLRAMERRHSLADAYAPSVRGFIFGQRHFPHVHGIVHALSIRLEHVQDQPPAGRKMLANALQAIHLLPHVQQVLKWPERDNHQPVFFAARSEEHTSELQSQSNLVCRLLLEKKKTTNLHSRTLSR